MNERRLLLGAGLACFVVFAATFIPATVITALLPTNELRIGGISGTLWNGEARPLEVAGFQVNRAQWELHQLALLLGRLEGTVEAEWQRGFAQGDIGLGLTGSVRVRDFTATGPVVQLTSRMNLPQSGGDLEVLVAALDVSEGWPSRAIGTVKIRNLPLAIVGAGAGAIGSYQVRFDTETTPDDGRISGELTDLDGPLAISGSIVFSPPANYEVNARIRAKPEAPRDLANSLALLGPEDETGNRQFTMAGSF
jgi:general secretion pathway protein N